MECPFDGENVKVVNYAVGGERRVSGFKCPACGTVFTIDFIEKMVVSAAEEYCSRFNIPFVTKKGIQNFLPFKVDNILLNRILDNLVKSKVLAKYMRGNYILVSRCGRNLKTVLAKYGNVLFSRSKKIMFYVSEDGSEMYDVREVERAIENASILDVCEEQKSKIEESSKAVVEEE
ncbi:MAG: hypothetical protein QXK18_07825 [Candidatus Bathyarchaeia archaeon]